MSLFDKLFKNRPATPKMTTEFKLLNGYRPVFTNWSGSIYESELIRSAINAIATHISKLRVELEGTARPALRTKLKNGPNSFQTWDQFLYRLATILYVHNTAFIVPVFDEYGEPSGVFAPLPHKYEVREKNGVEYLKYYFSNGNSAAIELDFCGIMTRFQYSNDLFGETNAALASTMDLIHIQEQGIKEGIKNSATYQFMARLTNYALDEDIAEERKRFNELNFSKDADGGGTLLFPSTYTDVKQIDHKPWVIDNEQMQAIERNVYAYFGVNEDILMNKAYGDKWTAFYEGVIEPFAIQFSEVLTKMLFTMNERSRGNYVMATANRLQYLSNNEKLQVSTQLMDRGVISINDAREIWQLPPVDGGDVRIIRGEYYDADEKVAEVKENENS